MAPTERVARVKREGRVWLVEIERVGVTQARSLSEAQEMAADLIAVMTGDRVPAAEVILEYGT
jgi:hypothetical protein